MENFQTLQRDIELIFKIKCNKNCQFICERSSKMLGAIIKETAQTASNVLCYYFITNSGEFIKGKNVDKSKMITSLGKDIMNIRQGYIEIEVTNEPDTHIESFVFGVVDFMKETIKEIFPPVVGRINNQLSTYENFNYLQQYFEDIITNEENLENTIEYEIFRQNEKFSGKIEGKGQERMKSIIAASDNIKKDSEYIIAVSIVMWSANNKTAESKRIVLVMV